MAANNSSLRIEQNKRPHILIIRLSAMGDVAMTVPIISALVQQYPSVKVTILTRDFLNPCFLNFPM